MASSCVCFVICLVCAVEQVDSDHSGSISVDEFMAAALSKQAYAQREALVAAFQKIDLDGSGTAVNRPVRPRYASAPVSSWPCARRLVAAAVRCVPWAVPSPHRIIYYIMRACMACTGEIDGTELRQLLPPEVDVGAALAEIGKNPEDKINFQAGHMQG